LIGQYRTVQDNDEYKLLFCTVFGAKNTRKKVEVQGEVQISR
jgi:hypothetical protein